MNERLAFVDPSVGLAWIDDSLASGGTLARAFRDAAKLDAGRIGAIVPTPDVASHLERGFGTRDASARLLFDLLRRGYASDTRLVVEDELMRRSDHDDPRRFGTPVVFHGNEVLHWQTLGVFTDGQRLEDFLNWSTTGHPLNAFVVSLDAFGFEDSAEVDDYALQSAARDVRAAIVGAYDSDGFLIWLPAPESGS